MFAPHLMIATDADSKATTVGTAEDPAAAASAYLVWCANHAWVRWGAYPLFDYTCTNNTQTSILAPLPVGIAGVFIVVHGASYKPGNTASDSLYMQMQSSNNVVDTGANYKWTDSNSSNTSAPSIRVGFFGTTASPWTLNSKTVYYGGSSAIWVAGLTSTAAHPVTVISNWQQQANNVRGFGVWHPLACGVANNYCKGLNFTLQLGSPFASGSRVSVVSC